jgi:hypothetical protein
VKDGTAVPTGWVEVDKDDKPVEQKAKQTPTMSEMAKAKAEQDKAQTDRLMGGQHKAPPDKDKPPQK